MFNNLPVMFFVSILTLFCDQYAAWISQLNTTYTLLENINGTSASTTQPAGALFDNSTMFSNSTFPLINGTVYVYRCS